MTIKLVELTKIGRLCAQHVLSRAEYLELLLESKDRYLSSRNPHDRSGRRFPMELRSLLKRLITYVTPHQVDAQSPFEKETPLSVLHVVLSRLAPYFLQWHDGPGFRMDRLLAFQDLSQHIMVVQLMAALRAKERTEGFLKAEDPLHPRSMPNLSSPRLKAVFKRGLVELHQHYAASGMPDRQWTKALASPRRIFEKKYGFSDDLENLPRGWQPFDLYFHIQQAAWLRRLLVCLLKGAHHENELMDQLTELMKSACYTYAGRHPQPKQPTKAVRSTSPDVFDGELHFLTEAMVRVLRCRAPFSERDRVLGFALHYYLLVQNLFMQNFVQGSDHFGFEAFSRIERGTGLQFDKNRKLGEASEDYVANHDLIGIEMRLVPEAKPHEYRWIHENFIGSDNQPEQSDLKYWGLVFHVIKDKDKKRGGPFMLVRHHTLRHRVYRQLRALHVSRERFPELARRYLALDAANDERFAGPEVFAPSFRVFRKRFSLPSKADATGSRPIGITFHAGESFEHPLSGMRYVDESLDLLEMRSGDRIGHGLALGIDIAQWHEVMGAELRISAQGKWLDNLLWMQKVGKGKFPAEVQYYLDDTCRRLAEACYCEGLGSWRQTHYLMDAMTLRKAEPSRSLRKVDPMLERDHQQLKEQYKEEVYRLWDHYHSCPECRNQYDKPYWLSDPLFEKAIWYEALTQCQEWVLAKMHRMEIAIEVNPTSNLRIGPFYSMADHPIFRWFPVDPSKRKPYPAVTINGDNYVVFQTTLPLEYSYLAKAAEERGHNKDEIGEWLESIRRYGLDYSFLKLRS